MDKRQFLRLSKHPNWGAFQITVLYLLIGGLWILLSDKIAIAIAPNKEVLTNISIYKGWGYVLVTALLLYWLIRRHTAEIHTNRLRLQQVIDALPVLISYVDKEGRYQFKNKTYDEWFGDTARGETPEEVGGKEAYQAVSKYVDKVLQGETVSYESVISLVSGERSIHATYIPDKASDGQIPGFYALVQDISERKRAEEENKSIARFPNENPNPVLRANQEGQILYANTASELLLNDWHCQVGGYLPQDWIILVKESINSGAKKNIDIECEKTIYSIVLAPIPGTNYINLYGSDITERKQVETALLESTLQFRTLFEASPDANLLIDPRGSWSILDCNTAACQMNGYTYEELVGQSIDILNPDPFPDAGKEEYLANIRQAGVLRYETVHRRKDGSEFPVEVSTSLISLGGREMLLGIDRDITERKRAEQVERLERARWQGIVEGIADEVWMCDVQGRMSLLNLDSVTAMGLMAFKDKTVEEVYQEVAIFYLDGRLRPPEQAPLLRSLRGEVVRGEEIMQHRQTGKRRYRQFSSAPTRDANGAITGAVAIVRDITDQKVAEEGLRRFELLSEYSRDLILFMRREDGHILEANVAATQAYGYSHDELLALTIQDLRAGHTRVLTADQMQQADKEGILFETIHVRKDGTTFPVEVSARGTTIGEVRTLISIIRDITARKQAERALRESQVRLNFALEKSHTGGWDLDLVDHTAFRTLEHDRIFGYESLLPEWTYEMFLDHVIPEDRAEVDRLFQEATATQTNWSFECRIRRIDGEVRWIWVVGGHLFDETGHAYRMAGIVQDTTERKQAEDEIRRLNEQLEQRVIERTAQLESANKELEAFSYSVSHDLRAPLRAIDGYTNILVEDYEMKLDTEGKRICGVISAEAQRMGQLIDDLLAFSRLGRKEMYSSQIDMQKLVVSIYNELSKQQDQERIDFQIGELPNVKADPSLIRQVWINLLSNAIKFTSKKERAIIQVGSQQSTEEYIYSVHDTGAGFDMEYANKLFGVFQRLHGESEFEGTGVGLAIVQRIIHRHGGRVWAEGEPEKGATFYFALPHKEGQHEQ